MNSKRRTLLKGTLAAGAVGVAASAGLLAPRTVLAAWPKSAFAAKGVDASLTALYGKAGASDAKNIKIKAPDIAENGAVVSVHVKMFGFEFAKMAMTSFLIYLSGAMFGNLFFHLNVLGSEFIRF